MTRALAHEPPESAGFGAGEELPAVGRASRFASEDGAELWRLPREDEAIARRLLDLGEANVGGFVAGGIDSEGVWLARSASGTALQDAIRAKKGAWPWREALGVAERLAIALAACEKAALFPGPLTPDSIVVRDDAALLPASGLVGALCGTAEPAPRRADTASPLWIPPPQLDGVAWDGVANRYALGLVLYRLLSGEHPFSGGGLRHALDEAARHAPPPFREVIAATLPAGLQSLTLRMLDPDEDTRPAKASEIAEALGGFLEGPRPPRATRSTAAGPTATRSTATRSTATRSPATQVDVAEPTGGSDSPRLPNPVRARSRPQPPSKSRYWPILAGLAVALAALGLTALSPPAPPSASAALPTVPATEALSLAQTAATDCAACHPRQAAEWRRSVMAHSVKSPLFNALEILIEEQVGRDRDCPNGAGAMRKASPSTACLAPGSNLPITGSAGEHWCVNCHSPAEKTEKLLPTWEGRPGGDPRSRLPVRDLLGERSLEGISCGFCHTVHGPVGPRGSGGYEGNATWRSFVTGAVFASRPEDGRGLFGIGNSGYDVRPEVFLLGRGTALNDGPRVHRRAPESARAYLRTSEFCGSCHDVRLFGTDVLGAAQGEHYKRLRNAYSEWAVWAAGERRKGKTPASCQDCHMSAFPGVCELDPSGSTHEPGCPDGYRFAPRAPGALPRGRVSEGSSGIESVTTHYFSGVDVPLGLDYPASIIDEPTVDLHGIPLSARKRRDMLLRRAFRFALGAARRGGRGLEIPVEIENVGAGHRVPAGFSQEREFWVHLVVRDGNDRVVYEVGRVDRGDEDLHDKTFLRVNVRGDDRDGRDRPIGLFGADVRDGPDVPLWEPPPAHGGTSFRGRGLINFQNGFLRCVRCIGTIAPDGRCEAGAGQNDHRAARFADGAYDLDTGACRSNLVGSNALFETYFPIGALDASRGLVKGPDAIIDTRSLPPGVPIRYTYELPTNGRRGPFKVQARLLFRAFPPFLIKAFSAYEREQARRGKRPSGPLVSEDALARLDVVEIEHAEAEIR
jgi:eukaryotic-like serine/threonine-protein kinase